MSRADAAMYLRPDVKMEPLLMRWHAWPHLMAPVQHALNVAFRHIPQMESFIQNPKVHLAAARDPKMFGGPFLDVAERDVPNVKLLLDETKKQCADMIKFAGEFRGFRRQILMNCKGYSLKDYYENIPESLRGAVELWYDVSNQPEIHIIEELLSGGDLDSRHVEEVCLSKVKEIERPFFMSSPRLSNGDDLNVAMKFDDERVDTLAKLRTSPAALDEIIDDLKLHEYPREKVAGFFTAAAPRRNDTAYDSDLVRVRYFCHACVLLQSRGVSILVDPMLSYEPGESGKKFTFYDLPDVIDYVIISHSHLDHFCPEVLMQIRHRVKKVIVPRNNRGAIADPSLKMILQKLGFRDVMALSPFDKVDFPLGEIVSFPFPGEHAELDIQGKQSIKVSISGKSFLFLIDSNAIDPQLYVRLANRIGPIDVLFMGMECHGAPLSWQYGPLMTQPIVKRDDESRRLDGSDAARASKVIDALDCKRVFVYAMGHEKWVRFIVGMDFDPSSYQVLESEKFIAYCRQSGIAAERLYEFKELVI